MDTQLRYLKRGRFFQGQILTAVDLSAEQDYHIECRRRHNRWLHGWGVVSGLEVSISDSEVTVGPGVAIDCRGEEVILPAPGTLSLTAAPSDWATLYLLISASEKPTDPVPLPDGTTDYSCVLETSRLELQPEDPTAAHVERQGLGQACGAVHGVPLGRFKRNGKGWRLDARYRLRRVR